MGSRRGHGCQQLSDKKKAEMVFLGIRSLPTPEVDNSIVDGVVDMPPIDGCNTPSLSDLFVNHHTGTSPGLSILSPSRVISAGGSGYTADVTSHLVRDKLQTFTTISFSQRLHLLSIDIIMVWVSNRTSQTIKVAISVKSGGDAHTFEVVPETSLVESSAQNLWGRGGLETATVILEKSGARFQAEVNPSDVLLVYTDTYIVHASTKQQKF
ncbi:hypothetical protein AB1N83_003400 [Pleurotus pulmonarius]